MLAPSVGGVVFSREWACPVPRGEVEQIHLIELLPAVVSAENDHAVSVGDGRMLRSCLGIVGSSIRRIIRLVRRGHVASPYLSPAVGGVEAIIVAVAAKEVETVGEGDEGVAGAKRRQ